MDMEYPMGDHRQILCFILRFVNLRDLRIKGIQDHAHSVHDGDLHLDVDTFPPLDGTPDPELLTGKG